MKSEAGTSGVATFVEIENVVKSNADPAAVGMSEAMYRKIKFVNRIIPYAKGIIPKKYVPEEPQRKIRGASAAGQESLTLRRFLCRPGNDRCPSLLHE